MSKDLREFLQAAKRAGPDYYVEVKKPLKPDLEPFVLQQKLAKEGRFPVMYCPKIEGSKLGMVSNLFGSWDLLGLAMGIDPGKKKSELFQEYRKRETDPKPPRMVPGSGAPVKEIILTGKDIDLGILPIAKHYELNSGKYIIIGCMLCKHPDTGIVNAGVYRHEVQAKNQLGAFLAPGQNADYIAKRHAELGKPMEVVLFDGHHPAVISGSLVKGGLGRKKLEVMGGILGEPLEMTKGETVDIPVPTHAEIAIEGVIDAAKMGTDGPFSEYMGYYGLGDNPCYVIRVTAITMRKDAIYNDLDPLHREHNLAGVMTKQNAAFEAIKKRVPTAKDICMPPSGHCGNHVYVSIAKRNPGDGKAAGLAALNGFYLATGAVVVDDDIDVYDEEEVLWAVATRVDWERDIFVLPGVGGPDLHPRSYDESHTKRGNLTSKIVIDATKPVTLPFSIRMAPRKDLWDSMNLKDYLR